MPVRKSVSKLDAFAETLASWLKREAGRYRKRRRNLKQLYRDLVSLGYEGSYDRVAAFARDWRQRQREAANRASRGTYVPLIFAPGEAFQFDWSEDWVRVGSRQASPGQRPLPRHGQPLLLRVRVLQPGGRLGERSGREERPRCSPSYLA